jgi:diacylglycerol O-acyltransferase
VASDPAGAAGQAAGTVRAFATLAPALWSASRSSLSGPIGQRRWYTWARASLDDVRDIERQLGGTVNDVVLAAISGGLRALLLARGEQPGPHMVRSLVPVSVRAPGEQTMDGNQVSAVLADLPVHLADPVQRLAAVRAELQALKTAHQAKAGQALITLGRYTPFPLLSWPARLVLGLPQRVIVTVTTNVPGPRQPLYAMGRQLVEILPYVPIATTVRTGVAIATYCGNITFGITGGRRGQPRPRRARPRHRRRPIRTTGRRQAPPPASTHRPRSTPGLTVKSHPASARAGGSARHGRRCPAMQSGSCTHPGPPTR